MQADRQTLRKLIPLIAAVYHAVKAEIADKPVYQANGGNPMWWPMVAKVVSHIAGYEIGRKQAADLYRKNVRDLSQAAKDAMIASVEPNVYREALKHVLEHGEAPEGAPPLVPGSNAELPEGEPEPVARRGKKRDPTPEELDALTAEDILRLTDMDVQIEKALSQARLYKRLYAAAKERAAFVSAAMGMLHDIVQTVEPVAWNKADIPVVHIRREQDAALIMADIHIGDAIHADTMGALNVYNFDVFREKGKRLFAGVQESLEMFREQGNVNKLWILGLGDWVTGTNIFPGQAHHIEFGAMQQAMKGAEELVAILQHFLELPGIETVQIECVPGNHGRPGKKGQDPFEDNWDLVLYEFVRLRLAAEKRIQMTWYPSWWMMPNIRGWDFLCAHGDEVKAWNGIPNYGFRRWGSKWRELLDSVGKRYDYGVIGHHHTEVEERNLIISGAWPGASFFSAKELQSGGAATQMFYSISEDYGLTWRRRLPLDPPKRVET